MANVDWLKELRAAGVKRAVFSEQSPNGEAKLLEVEFFPSFPPLDPDSFFPAADRATEPPPARTEDGPPNVAPHIPKAIASILKKGSVS